MTEFKTITDKSLIPNLKQAQEFVEGWVERLKLPNGDVILFNEEGKMKDLPINEKATTLVDSFNHGVLGLIIVGNVIHLPKSLRQRKW